MAESFQQYIKIRTFLGYRPKEILLELQDAFGDEAPTYASVQRWSKRFRDAVDSPLGSPLASQANFLTQEEQSDQQLESDSIEEGHGARKQVNGNANSAECLSSMNNLEKPKRSSASRSNHQKSIFSSNH